MPRLSVARDHDDDANLPERREVMALSGGDVTRELEELIAALDRRVPRVEQAGEAAIARDAAALREKAINRLAQLATNSAVATDSDPGDPK